MAQTSGGGSSQTDIQQILEAGQQAAQLLNSPIFNLAYRETVNRFFNEWLQTKVGHSNERETIFSRVTSLQAVANTLSEYVQQAEVLMQQHQQGEDQFRAEEYK